MSCRLRILRSYHLIMLLSTKTIVENPVAITNNLWSTTEFENKTATRGDHHQRHLHLHCLPHPHQDQQLYQDKEALHPVWAGIRNRIIMGHIASTWRAPLMIDILLLIYSEFVSSVSRRCYILVNSLMNLL